MYFRRNGISSVAATPATSYNSAQLKLFLRPCRDSGAAVLKTPRHCFSQTVIINARYRLTPRQYDISRHVAATNPRRRTRRTARFLCVLPSTYNYFFRAFTKFPIVIHTLKRQAFCLKYELRHRVYARAGRCSLKLFGFLYSSSRLEKRAQVITARAAKISPPFSISLRPLCFLNEPIRATLVAGVLGLEPN